MPNEPLYMFVVYENPKEYPGYWVVKRDIILSVGQIRDQKFILISTEYLDIESAMLRRGLAKLSRSPEDDPVIKETWI